MELIKGLREDTPPQPSDANHAVTWPGLRVGTAGVPHSALNFPERSVQVVGKEWGARGKLVIEGSLDGKHYAVLNDAQGVDLEFTADGLRTIAEAVLFVRPRVIGGDETTALTVTLMVRRNS